MIQRVQSLYYLVCMILIGFCLSGIDIYKFVHQNFYYSFNAYGFNLVDNNEKIISTDKGYFYLGGIALILLTFYTLMLYKNLKKQMKMSRITSFAYLIMIVSLVIFGATGGKYFFNGDNSRELGAGFSLLVIAFPFSYLAQLAIKRDKKLLDSLNRLR